MEHEKKRCKTCCKAPPGDRGWERPAREAGPVLWNETDSDYFSAFVSKLKFSSCHQTRTYTRPGEKCSYLKPPMPWEKMIKGYPESFGLKGPFQLIGRRQDPAET